MTLSIFACVLWILYSYAFPSSLVHTPLFPNRPQESWPLNSPASCKLKVTKIQLRCLCIEECTRLGLEVPLCGRALAQQAQDPEFHPLHRSQNKRERNELEWFPWKPGDRFIVTGSRCLTNITGNLWLLVLLLSLLVSFWGRVPHPSWNDGHQDLRLPWPSVRASFTIQPQEKPREKLSLVHSGSDAHP